ncbi:hypothetical protein [Jannaschia helgolandensis]|uniref:hypothetical protein n=1 Tax=Jannaschia helgolandensis TaxID=188906 RepID=UPI0030D9D7D7|tara:strand:+ start:4439 stop:4732 length:294 start_codon:yes stop_codon:yes gene_type:complete
MADPNHTTTTETPKSTVTHVETARSGGGNSALWLILGGVLVALVLFFIFAGGADVSNDNDAAEGAAAVGTAVEGAAGAIGDAAEGAADATNEAATGN